MKAKANALEIIRFGKPERIVVDLPCRRVGYHGVNHEGYAGGGHDCPVGSKWVDIWGTGWHKEHPGVMGFPRHCPLAEVDALRRYRWPDPDDPRICATIRPQADGFARDEQFLAGAHRDTLWEKAYMLVGMENLMVCFHTEPGFVREVLRRIMDFQLGIARHYLDIGVELVFLGDDLGAQRGSLLGPELMREFLLPEYRRLCDMYRRRGVLMNLHCCGCLHEALPMLMELGVDILNPVQASANDLDRVRAMTRGRMALLGGVSTRTIMDGPVSAIQAEVRRRLWQLGRDGGYFCAPDQEMPWKPDHIEALRRTVRDHGRYPIDPPPGG